MNVDSCKKHFEFVQQAYEDAGTRRALSWPRWIEDLKRDRRAAKVTHLCLQASVVSMLNRTPGMQRQLSLGQGMTEADFAASCAALRTLADIDESQDLLRPVFAQLQEYLRFTGGLATVREYVHAAAGLDPLHRLATEASGRNAAAVTPGEVVKFMVEMAKTERCDAYALDGLGLLYGGPNEVAIKLVGDEFRSGQAFQMPTPLVEIFKDAGRWFEPAEFANRAYVELENMLHHKPGSADALLVNAARLDLPFYPGSTEEEEDLGEAPGLLNACLRAGYARVVVLVSNHYLTAGRGRARKILDHCLQHGLRQVIQLPMGVVGVRSQAHSVLVFEQTPNTGEVEFIDLSDDRYTHSTTKGFGWPRRAMQLVMNDLLLTPSRNVVAVPALLNRGQLQGKARKIVSFEVGQFSQEDPLQALRGTYEFMRLHEFMEVFRSHHIVETGEEERAEDFEDGANDNSEEGWIRLGKRNDRPFSSLERRKAQILQDQDLILCFRGSPDSYAKVGLYRLTQNLPAVPNQSFVILRRKSDAPSHAPTAIQVLWWLKSDHAQQYLRQKAISPDVMRVAPRDIAALEIPWGPSELMERESTKITRAEAAARSIQALQAQISHLHRQAWNGKTLVEQPSSD